MSSVQDLRECPQCSYEGAHGLFDCSTREDWIDCPLCGFAYEWSIIQTDGNSSSPGIPELDDGRPQYQQKVRAGCGAYWLEEKTGRVESGGFATPPTAAELAELEQLIDTNPEISPERSFVTVWDPAIASALAVIGKFHGLYDKEPAQEMIDRLSHATVWDCSTSSDYDPFGEAGEVFDQEAAPQG